MYVHSKCGCMLYLSPAHKPKTFMSVCLCLLDYSAILKFNAKEYSVNYSEKWDVPRKPVSS